MATCCSLKNGITTRGREKNYIGTNNSKRIGNIKVRCKLYTIVAHMVNLEKTLTLFMVTVIAKIINLVMDGIRPTVFDVVGVFVIVLGTLIIVLAPKS
jgi:hypothetical protein